MEKFKNNIGPALCLLALIVGISVAVIDFSGSSKDVKEVIEYGLPKPHEIADTVLLEPFSEANLIKEINRKHILYGNVVYAQARLETGNFKSEVFKKNNNLFGFVGKNGYIKYTSWQKSVEDYKQWQYNRWRGSTLGSNTESYYAFLEKVGYAEDSLYTEKLRRME